MEPNPQQQAVIDFGVSGSGSLNLIACAGTGKTTTLLQLVKYLDGATWFCAFNKAIIGEIQYKVTNTKGLNPDNVRVSTVHSAGMRAWGKHCFPTKFRVESRKVQNIIDDLGDPMQAERHGMHADEIYVKRGTMIRRLVDYAKSAGFGVLQRITSIQNWRDLIDHYGLDLDDDGRDGEDPWYDIIGASIVVYQRSLAMCRREIDFSDMLLAPLYFKAKFPKYDNILIDEAQDISPLRLKIILSCLKQGGRVIAVGDPNQAIYGFTGADSASMDSIKEWTGAIELPLTVTYRCPKSIVALAQQWVPRIQAHESAPEGIVREVDLKHESKLDSVTPNGKVPTFWDCVPFTASDAVLCRNTKPLVSLAYDCLRRRIPCMIEGREIGQGLINLAKRWKVNNLHELSIELNGYKIREMAKFTQMKQEFKVAEVEDRCDTLDVLIQATEEMGGSTVTNLVDLINRMFGDTPEGEKPKVMIMSTVHKSKGREWPRVFILGRNAYMPSKFAKKPWEREQEDNLQYVAVTRAQKELIDIHVPEK